MLTSINLVVIAKGVFGAKKGVRTFPLNQIKVYNGQAQVIIAKELGSYPQLDIYLFTGQESFTFLKKKDAADWALAINKAVTGSEGDFSSPAIMAIPGAATVAKTLKGTASVFRGALGIKNKDEAGGQIATKCSSCGAPISGAQGQLVNCPYCSTPQQLN